ncbi:hypothetical protein [Clostridium perfringens]|uniref:hypothetical protein n=1 Tax=Clostridium perfringens TaxID=1502 RepID=UPI002FCD529C
MNENLKQKIIEEYRDQFELAEELEKFVEENLVSTINSYNVEFDEIEVFKAITLLFGQSVLNHKSCTILISEGYAASSLSILRSTIEIILNIDYILISPNAMKDRASKYLSTPSKNQCAVSTKACNGFNEYLYKIYCELCDFTHSNSKSTYKNILNNELIINPSDNLTKESILLTNVTFAYLLKRICKYFDLDFTSMLSESNLNNLGCLLNYFNKDKVIYDIFKNFGIGNKKIKEIIKGFNQYTSNK